MKECINLVSIVERQQHEAVFSCQEQRNSLLSDLSSAYKLVRTIFW